MFLKRSDKEWEKFGTKCPYYGVISHKKYYKGCLTEPEKEEFFRTGQEHVNHMLETIRNKIDEKFILKKVLDFGCGVGRVAIPLAESSQHVTAVDVSTSMLKEAELSFLN